MDNRDTELRSAWWSRLAGHLLWLVAIPWCMSLRKRFVASEAERARTPGTEPVIAAFWHNRAFPTAHFHRYVIRQRVPMCLLSSASKDGAMMETFVDHYGIRVVRGSSSRRGIAAFKGLLRAAREGCSISITTDGPKGPVYKSHPGVVKLASLTGLPIVPVSVDMPCCWRAKKAWDKFAVPLPFSKVTLFWGDRISVPADASDEVLAEYAQRLDAAMSHGRPDFEPIDDFIQQQRHDTDTD